MNILKVLKMSTTATAQFHILMTTGQDVPERHGNAAQKLI